MEFYKMKVGFWNGRKKVAIFHNLKDIFIKYLEMEVINWNMVIILILFQMYPGDHKKQINYRQPKLKIWGFLYVFFVVWPGISELLVLLVNLCNGAVMNLFLSFPNSLISNWAPHMSNWGYWEEVIVTHLILINH